MSQFLAKTQTGCRRTFPRYLLHRIATRAVLTLIAVTAQLLHTQRLPAEQPTRPNIVLIMADDMGYGDSTVYGGWIETPHLERMARGGVTFSDFHSSGVVCSPTRAGLLTGRYQQRAGIPGVVNADPNTADHHRGLQLSEVTFAERLRGAGYRTAIFGKWHLGYDVKYSPVHQGFDEFRGFVSGNIDYISHYDRMETYDWWNGTKKVNEEGYLTELITQHAVRFINEHHDEPFCLYVPHGAVHSPIQAADSPAQRGPQKVRRGERDARPQDEVVRLMMQSLDASVGAILDAVEAAGIAEETFVFFFSDNGGAGHMRCDPLRGKKGTVWEGGHRVPAIAWWPGKIEPGRKTDQLCISLDLMPTMLDMAGIDSNSDRQFDGVSLVPLLLEGQSLEPRQLYWNGLAMREGPWKLIATANRKRTELYNLDVDLLETTNVADAHPERVDRMLNALAAWKRDVAEGATPQPAAEAFAP